MKKVVAVNALLLSSAFAFYPFTGEDTDTLGGFGNFQFELQTAYFKNYDDLKHTNIVTQLTLGITQTMDIAFILPYTTQSNGESVSGFSDFGFFVKHILIKTENIGLGYKVQVNFDTGEKELSYGKTTYNFNLMYEYTIANTTLNINGVYNKFSHVGEDLRDSKGVIVGLYHSPKDNIKLGGEFKYLEHESKATNKKHMDILIGTVYSPFQNVDLSFGFHKGLNKYSKFTDYGVLAGIAYRF